VAGNGWLTQSYHTDTISQTHPPFITFKGIVHSEMENYATINSLKSFQTNMTFFLVWNTKGDVLENVQTAISIKT